MTNDTVMIRIQEVTYGRDFNLESALGNEMKAKKKVGFCWGAVPGTFYVDFSPLETQKFPPYRFYCLKSGCNNLFSLLPIQTICAQKITGKSSIGNKEDL